MTKSGDQHALARILMRRSLKHFHQAAFSMMHGGEPLLQLPHMDAMIHVLQKLALGDIKRLIITLPPRHGKSELASCAFPAWVLGNDPNAKVTVVSYGKELSVPLVNKSRGIVKHPAYGRIFPNTGIRRGQDRMEYFEVAGGGSLRAASQDGAMTGLGTHFMIVDDFQKAGEALSPVERENSIEIFRTTFLNRFDNLNDSRIVIIMQRFHEDDLVGWALRTGNWHHLCLPARAEQNEDIPLPSGEIWHRRKGDVLAPALASDEYLREQLTFLGTRHYGAQYQQNPCVAEGALIDMGWFGQFDERPARNFFHKVVQSIDPAATDRITSDYSVGHTWGFRDGIWYLLDAFRKQLAFADLVDQVIADHRQWRADALIIEGGSIGESLYSYVKRENLPGIFRCFTPHGSKRDRLAACTAQLRTGNFWLPASAEWLPAFRHELLAFPDGRNDDHVDALSQFVKFTFDSDRWVKTERDRRGRRIDLPRRERRPNFYGGDYPSAGSDRDPDE